MSDTLVKVSAGDADIFALLRMASEALEPVVIEIGAERARFDAYVDGVDERSVVLSQLAAHALPHGAARLRILSTCGADRWCITADHVEPIGDSSARIDLSRARLDSEPSSALALATDLLVLVVPGGLHDSNAYVFPIQRVSALECEIRSSVALPPGHALDCVEISGDRRLLRRASAQVLETLPWYHADGTRAFSMRLALGDPPDDEVWRASHDLVTGASEVRRLLKLAVMMRSSGWYEAPGQARGVLEVVAKDSADVSFELAQPTATRLVGATIRIGIELFATQYELDVRVIASDQHALRTALPLILRRRRRHRRDHRVPVSPQHRVELAFRNPVTGSVQVMRVAEVSFFTLELLCPAHAAVLWRGLPLEQAQLTFGSRLVHLGDLVVEEVEPGSHAGSARCTAAISNSGVADDPDMIFLLATLAHPQVRVHDGRDFAALHAIYLRAGLFGPHMHRNLAPIFEQTRGVWHRLHSGAADVVRTFVHGPEATPDAAVTVMRAWEHAWVLQHFVDSSPERSGATGRLQAAYLDHLVPRPDGRYLLFFVKTDNHVMNAYLRRFFAATGTPEAVTRSNVELWIRAPAPVPEPDAPTDFEVRSLRDGDHPLVLRAAQRWLGVNAAAALSFAPDELHLPDTHARFARAGLERARTCDVVCQGGRPVCALIEERSTPGVNLTWMLNATWVLPLRPGLEADGNALEAALRALLQRESQSSTGEQFLNLPAGLPEAVLARLGFAREASLYLYVLTRAGLHRFLHYAAERYGENDALTQRRRSRAPRAPD